MPLFETLPVDRAAVEASVASAWGLTLDAGVLKESQNHTFSAHDASGAKFAVRVTPDPEGKQTARIADEVTFVTFLHSKAALEGVCFPVPAKDGQPFVRTGSFTICIYPWAAGTAVDFVAFKWMTVEAIVTAWGAWMARLHAASRKFAAEHPEVASRMRKWDEIHEGVMKGAELHPDDAAVAAGGLSSDWIVTHGDLNLSNFSLQEEAAPAGDASASPSYKLSVYDWDQTHLGWPEWDMAQSCLAVLMLSEAGMVPAGTPVPEADLPRFVGWFTAGYESVAGAGAVSRGRFDRMLALRKSFYGRFARQAFAEGGLPPGMDVFLTYVDNWCSGGVHAKEYAERQAKAKEAAAAAAAAAASSDGAAGGAAATSATA